MFKRRSARKANSTPSKHTTKAPIQAYGYSVNAASDTAQAGLDEATAENAIPGAALGATGTLLGNNKFTGWIGGTDAGANSLPNIPGAGPSWAGRHGRRREGF